MRLATGEAPREADGAALPSADGEHEASSSSMTRTEEQRTGNGGGGASHMLLTHSPPLPSKETNEKKSRLLGLAQEIAPGTCGFAAIGHSGVPFYSVRTRGHGGRRRERRGARPGGRASGHMCGWLHLTGLELRSWTVVGTGRVVAWTADELLTVLERSSEKIGLPRGTASFPRRGPKLISAPHPPPPKLNSRSSNARPACQPTRG
jgi:hypothetical protein